MAKLLLENREFDLKELSSVRLPLDILSPYSNKVLQIAQNWVLGQETFFLQSSGTTGIPKTLTFTREEIIRSAELTFKTFKLEKEDKLFCCLNVNYVAGFMMIMRALVNQMNISVVKPSTHLMEFLVDEDFDFTAMVPLQIGSLIKGGSEAIATLNNMKSIIIGSAGISPKLESQLHEIKPPVYHTYGMTESLTHVATRRINGINRSSYYQALDGVSFETDERGCLVIYSPVVMKKLTTNDLVELLSSNKFLLLGRIDHVINSGGVKVHPERTEHQIAELIETEKLHYLSEKNYLIAGMPDENLGSKVVLLIEGHLSTEEKNDLLPRLKNKLPEYEVPREILSCNEFAYTQTGKIRRSKTVATSNCH